MLWFFFLVSCWDRGRGLKYMDVVLGVVVGIFGCFFVLCLLVIFFSRLNFGVRKCCFLGNRVVRMFVIIVEVVEC